MKLAAARFTRLTIAIAALAPALVAAPMTLAQAPPSTPAASAALPPSVAPTPSTATPLTAAPPPTAAAPPCTPTLESKLDRFSGLTVLSNPDSPKDLPTPPTPSDSPQDHSRDLLKAYLAKMTGPPQFILVVMLDSQTSAYKGAMLGFLATSLSPRFSACQPRFLLNGKPLSPSVSGVWLWKYDVEVVNSLYGESSFVETLRVEGVKEAELRALAAVGPNGKIEYALCAKEFELTAEDVCNLVGAYNAIRGKGPTPGKK